MTCPQPSSQVPSARDEDITYNHIIIMPEKYFLASASSFIRGLMAARVFFFFAKLHFSPVLFYI